MLDTFIAPPCPESIKIVYQDDSLLVINKPSGLLSLSGKNPLNKDSVHYRLVQDYPSATLVHRLDFGTSGLMVVALNKVVNGHLTRQFQDRQVAKTYTAVLQGHMECNSGEITIPIIKDADNFPYQKVCYHTGKQASSAYEVLAREDKPKTTRVTFTPQTGRTHQLRIHSQAAGHPILGCDLYGDASSLAMAERLLLHATTLAFTHPLNEQPVAFNATCPF